MKKVMTETIAALRAADLRAANPAFGKAMHAAITLSGVLAPDSNPLHRRILRHAIVDVAACDRPTWGRLLHGGLEETLVSPEHWGRFSQWGWGDTYQSERDCPVLSGECATSTHGNGFTVIEVTVKVAGVWYAALDTGRRHNYVAVLFRDGELLRAFPSPSADDEVQAAVDAEIEAVKSRIYAEEFIAYVPVPREECLPSLWEAQDFARELPPTPHAARVLRAAARLRKAFEPIHEVTAAAVENEDDDDARP